MTVNSKFSRRMVKSLFFLTILVFFLFGGYLITVKSVSVESLRLDTEINSKNKISAQFSGKNLNSDKSISGLVGAYSGLVYSTYLGGNNDDGNWQQIEVDDVGNVYITGWTLSTDFPTVTGSYFTFNNGSMDAFVSKLNPDGRQLVYSTFIGGSGLDASYDIALDAYSNVIITGRTESADFPVTSGSFDTSYNGKGDIFICKLDGMGRNLLFSTYLGGSKNESYFQSIALDNANNVYVTGLLASDDYPVTTGVIDPSFNGSWDVFVSKLDSSGSLLIYSTYIGGGLSDAAFDLDVDSKGYVYLTGFTDSNDFPVTVATFDSIYNNLGDAFVCKINPSGTSLLYSTYLGGTNSDQAQTITVNNGGETFIGGVTQSMDFPVTPGVFDTSFNGLKDGFISCLNNDGRVLLYSTFIGGSSDDVVHSLFLNNGGDIFFVGGTISDDFPISIDAYNTLRTGANDVVTGKLSNNGSNLIYSTYIGGSGNDNGYDIKVDNSNYVYISGATESSDYPTTKGVFDTSFNGIRDSFITKLDLGPTARPSPTPTEIYLQKFNLCPGLNMVSIPYVDPDIPTSAELLTSICGTNVDAVWKYDCTADKFVSWTILDSGPGWNTKVGIPIWVNITAPSGCVWLARGFLDTSISYSLCAGLNMVSLPVYSTSLETASGMMGSIPGCVAVFQWKKMVSCHYPPSYNPYYDYSSSSDDFFLAPGYSYWIEVGTPGTWNPPYP